MLRLLTIVLLASTLGKPVLAEPPTVVTDIAPVHSLTALVMRGIGSPEILLPPGASPHDFALRPSAARTISKANLIVWIGADFTPWLARPMESLAPMARSLELIGLPETVTLPYRDDVIFERMEDDGKTPKAPHKGHDHGHGHAHHGEFELHAWQDPENAKAWLGAIATALSEIDPANGTAYHANAKTGVLELEALQRTLSEALLPIRDRPFIVMHDAYQYFEHRFGVRAVAALLPADGRPASAARIQAINLLMRDMGPTCIFVEPQISGALARNLAAEHDASVGTLDPIGDSLERGPRHYFEMLENLGRSLTDCLS